MKGIMSMKTRTLAIAVVLSLAGQALATQWNPQAVRDESTLEFLTVREGEEGHWSTVWFVVLDGDVYVNLGDRAANRLSTNTTAPFVSVRIDEAEFEHIRVNAAQDRQKEVAEAIADKYWSGFLVPYRPPSQVMRLRPE
jgi:hypothetical protein